LQEWGKKSEAWVSSLLARDSRSGFRGLKWKGRLSAKKNEIIIGEGQRSGMGRGGAGERTLKKDITKIAKMIL